MERTQASETHTLSSDLWEFHMAHLSTADDDLYETPGEGLRHRAEARQRAP